MHPVSKAVQWLDPFNAAVEFDNAADTKNGSLALNIEHNF